MESEETTPRSVYENNQLRVTISGQLKDNERNNHLNCITRCCQIRVADLKFTSETNLPPAITFIFSLNKMRRTLRSPPIDLPLENRDGNIDMRITFLYTHSLKEYDDILKIQIQANMKKKQRNDVIIAYTTLDLSLVLQHSLQDEEITFKAGTGERDEKKDGKGSHDKEKEKDKTKDKDTEKINVETTAQSQPFAVMYASVWSYPEEIETVEDANDYELVAETLSDDDDYYGAFGDSGGESNEDDNEISISSNTLNSGISNPNTPSKTLLSQRLIQQALEFGKTSKVQPTSTSSSGHHQHHHNQSTTTTSSSGGTQPSGKGQQSNKSRLRQRFWLSSKPILTRAKSKDSDSDKSYPGSDQEMDQYFESSSNSDPSDSEDRLSPGIEYTPPASPVTTRAAHSHLFSSHSHPHYNEHSTNSTPGSPSHAFSHVPTIPQWGSTGNLIEKYGTTSSITSSVSSSSGISNQNINVNSSNQSSTIPAVSSSLASAPSSVNVSNTNLHSLANLHATADVMRPNSPSVAGPKLGTSTDLSNASGIILINGSKWRGKRLEDCLTREISPLPNRYKVVITKRSVDVQTVITNIFARQQQLMRVAIAGSDSYINEVLRPFVEQLGKKPRGWDSLHFYILPIGKNNNDVATQVALHDPTYKALFFSPAWQHVFQQRDQCSDDECIDIQQRILQYLDQEITVPVRFQIGEALITYPDSVGKSVPFLKGVHIADPQTIGSQAPQSQQGVSNNDDEHEVNLQLDYWVPKKKVGAEDHLGYKGAFQFAVVTRLPCVAAALRLAPPNATGLSLLVQPRDKKGRKNVLSRHFATKLGKKGGKDEKEKGKNEKEKEKATKKKDEKDSLNALVTKLVCSVADDNVNGVFRAVIDGVEYPGVKFVSLSPQWANHVKTFTVQAFSFEGEFYPPAASTSSASLTPASAQEKTHASASAQEKTHASSSSQEKTHASSAQGTPTSTRGSPVLAGAQFPPLNLNAVKQPGSPLLKHTVTGSSSSSFSNSSSNLPLGMNSATDL